MNATAYRGETLSETDLDKLHGGGLLEVVGSTGTGAYQGFKVGSKFGAPGRVVGTVVGGVVGLVGGLFA